MKQAPIVGHKMQSHSKDYVAAACRELRRLGVAVRVRYLRAMTLTTEHVPSGRKEERTVQGWEIVPIGCNMKQFNAACDAGCAASGIMTEKQFKRWCRLNCCA